MENRINQFTEDMNKLLDMAGKLLPAGLLKDDSADTDISINIEKWERYKKIVYGILTAVKTGWDLLRVKYAEAPSGINSFASVTITLQKASSFTDEAKTAFAMAVMLADRISVTTDEDKVRISFTVNDLWKELDD